MNPLGNRARAEELARLLEGAVAGPGATTAGYAVLAARLRAVSPALQEATTLRPEFRSALRQRLVAVATVQGPVAVGAVSGVPAGTGALERAVTWSRTWTAQKRLALASGAMAGVVAVTGVAVASSRSLPGQPFYGLKRASEALQLDLTSGDTAKGTKHLEFAATRLREVRALARGDGELALAGGGGLQAAGLSASVQQRINDTLADFRSETTEGRQLLERAYRKTGRTAPLRVLTSFAAQQKSRLTAIIPELPSGSTTAATQSLQLVSEVGSTATELLALGTCGDACNPDQAGPLLPAEPEPSPGTSASPETPEENNGVPPCDCAEPTPSPEPTTEPSTEPTTEPSTEPTTSPEPSSTPTPTTSPTPGPVLPTILPTDLPTILPTDLPTLPPLPLLPSILPTLLPHAVVKP